MSGVSLRVDKSIKPSESTIKADCRPLFIVLAIIGVLGICLAAVGVAGYGQCKNWWDASLLSGIGKLNSLIFTVSGFGGGFIFLAIASYGLLKKKASDNKESKPVIDDEQPGLTVSAPSKPQAKVVVEDDVEPGAVIPLSLAEKARKADFQLVSSKIEMSQDIAKSQLMKLYLKEKTPFKTLLAQKLQDGSVEKLTFEPTAYPKMVQPNKSAIEKIAGKYQRKYGIEIHVVTLANLQSFLTDQAKNRGKFIGVIVSQNDQPSSHVASLLCYCDGDQSEGLLYDPISADIKFSTAVFNCLGSCLKEVFVYAMTHADLCYPRTADLLFLRDALKDLKSQPRKFSTFLQQQFIRELPPSWLVSSPVYKQKEPLSADLLKFRQKSDENITFKCTLQLKDDALKALVPADVTFDEASKTITFNFTMRVNQYAFWKALQYLDEAAR